jgi:hypothetical protein
MRIGFSASEVFAVFAAALYVAILPVGLAQSFDIDASRLPIAQVDSAWRFHLEDEPQLARQTSTIPIGQLCNRRWIGQRKAMPKTRSLPGSAFVFALPPTHCRWSSNSRPSLSNTRRGTNWGCEWIVGYSSLPGLGKGWRSYSQNSRRSHVLLLI